MNLPGLTIFRMGKKWIAVAAFSLVAVGAFATLGDGKKKSSSTTRPALMSSRTSSGYFTLRSGYTFRGSQVINTDKKYFSLNTVVTVQKGNTAYIVPIRKKVLISNVKIELGNRQFRR